MSEGGRLIVEVPNNAARAFGLFGALWPWADVPRHLHFFTERSLRATIEREGFTVTDVFYVGYTRQFKQDWTKTQETIWRGLGALTKQPRFDVAAWRLLAKTAFASRAHKYDSIRVHAELRAA